MLAAIDTMKKTAEDATQKLHGWTITVKVRKPKAGEEAKCRATDIQVTAPKSKTKVRRIEASAPRAAMLARVPN